MDVPSKKRRPKLVFAALNTIRSKQKSTRNVAHSHLPASSSLPSSKWTPFAKTPKSRKPLGDVLKSQRQQSGLALKTRQLSKPVKFEIFNQDITQKSEEQKAEVDVQKEQDALEQHVDIEIKDGVKEDAVNNKRKLESSAVPGVLKSILKRRRFKGGRSTRRKSGRMTQRRHTESSVEKSIRFGSEVIVRRYSQDLPATSYGKELQLTLNEEKKSRVAELAPVYSHFMSEDDTELKFNDLDNDSASDSEQFSPLAKPLTIFPSPSFRPTSKPESVSLPCPPSDPLVSANVDQMLEQIPEPHMEPSSPVSQKSSQGKGTGSEEIRLVSPTSSVHSSDTEIVDSDEEDPASDRMVPRSPILESVETVEHNVLASPLFDPVDAVEEEPVEIKHRLSFGSSNLSPAAFPLTPSSTTSIARASDSNTPKEKQCSNSPLHNIVSSECRQETPQVNGNLTANKTAKRLRPSILEDGPIVCSLQTCLQLTYCQTFAGFADKDEGMPSIDPSGVLEPACSLQRLCLNDKTES